VTRSGAAAGTSEGEVVPTPCAPEGTLTLLSCCYHRKLPRPDSAPVWLGPCSLGGGGAATRADFAGDPVPLLDWRSAMQAVGVAPAAPPPPPPLAWP
jgi:hypothetical protein